MPARSGGCCNGASKEGANVVVGGTGRPEGIDKGYFVKPTVFADVDNNMTIAREEIFDPVLALIGYEDEDDAVRIANDRSTASPGWSRRQIRSVRAR